MANRYVNQFTYSFDRAPFTIDLVCDGNATSAPIPRMWDSGKKAYIAFPTAGYRGVKSVARSSQGLWLVTFQDTYNRLLGMNMTAYAIDESTAPLIQGCYIKTQTTSSLGIVLFGYAANTAIDAAANDRLYFTFRLSNSSAL